MQNNFSYEYNQQRNFKMDYDYYPQQPYGFQQQPIVTPTIMLDISRLTMCELNDLYFRSFFWKMIINNHMSMVLNNNKYN